MAKRNRNGLTDMQAEFVRHYLISLDATKSAIAAGYSEKTAGQLGYQLLQNPSISDALRKAMEQRANRLELKADVILSEVLKLALSDIRRVCEFDDEKGVTLKSSSEIEADVAATILSIESRRETRWEGKLGAREPVHITTTKFKLHDKLRALDLAGRHLGLWRGEEEGKSAKETLADLLKKLDESA